MAVRSQSGGKSKTGGGAIEGSIWNTKAGPQKAKDKNGSPVIQTAVTEKQKKSAGADGAGDASRVRVESQKSSAEK